MGKEVSVARAILSQALSTLKEGAETRSKSKQNSTKCARISVDKRLRGLLVGMVLGDGCLRLAQGKHATLTITHSEKQSEYLQHKVDLLGEYGLSGKVHLFSNTGYSGVRFEKGHKFFRILRKRMYPKGKKTITREILNHLTLQGIALWYMDDGSLSAKKRNGKIHAYELTLSTYICKEQNEVIINYFKEVHDIQFRMRQNKGKYLLRMGTREARRFLKLILPYLIPSMAYKARLFEDLDLSAPHLSSDEKIS